MDSQRMSHRFLFIHNHLDEFCICFGTRDEKRHLLRGRLRIIRPRTAKGDRTLKDAVNATSSPFCQSDSLQCIRQQWISSAGLRRQQIFQRNPFNESARIADGQPLITDLNAHASHHRVIPMGKRIDQALAKSRL